MPYYGSIEVGGYLITAKPYCFLRRIIRYRLGNTIRFKLEITKTDKAQKTFRELDQIIFEQFPNQMKPQPSGFKLDIDSDSLNKSVNYSMSSIIQREGIVRCFIGDNHESVLSRLKEIYSSEVLHPDDTRGWWWRELLLVFITAIVGGVVGALIQNLFLP